MTHRNQRQLVSYLLGLGVVLTLTLGAGGAILAAFGGGRILGFGCAGAAIFARLCAFFARQRRVRFRRPGSARRSGFGRSAFRRGLAGAACGSCDTRLRRPHRN